MHLQLSSLLKLSVIHLFIYLRSGVFFKGKIKRESRRTGKEQKKKKKEEEDGDRLIAGSRISRTGV